MIFKRPSTQLNDGGAIGVCMREVKDSVCGHGRRWMVERCQAKAPLVAEVACRTSWAKVCQDACMDWGISCTRGLQAVVRVMGQGYNPCPLGGDDCPAVSPDSLLHHLLTQHADSLGLSDEGEVIASITELQLQKFTRLKNLFHATRY